MLDERSPNAEPTAPQTRTARVLLADDDALSRQLLGAALERSGFQVETAADGDETLRLIATGGPDLLVLDFEMPGLNGAEVCQQLRASEHEDLRSLPVIMLTAHVGEAEEIGCLQAGANDFVTKPVSREVLAARIETQLRLRNLSVELRQQNEELARWRAAQEADLAAAQATQRALIPTSAPALSGWSVQWLYQPVIQVGGDVLGWRPIKGGKWLFWLADATGHGAAAALFTALAAQLFDHACETENHPAKILDAVDGAFRNIFGGHAYMTACCAVVSARGSLTFAGAGHPPLFVRRADGSVHSFGPHRTMLGIANGASDESHLTLARGDVALLYTDGIFALKHPDGERFTPETVATELPATAVGPGFIDCLQATLIEKSSGGPCEDDVAAIALIRE